VSPFRRAQAALEAAAALDESPRSSDVPVEGDRPFTFNDMLKLLEKASLFTPDLNVLECQKVRALG
jgi:hypothetical protein